MRRLGQPVESAQLDDAAFELVRQLERIAHSQCDEHNIYAVAQLVRGMDTVRRTAAMAQRFVPKPS